MAIKFEDYSIEVTNAITDASIAFLEESKDVLASQASRNSPVQSGDLKRSFQSDSQVDEGVMKAYIGSSLEYAVWQEMGTGEFALEGNGRQGGWVYLDPNTGKRVFTRGNRPKRMLYHAFQQKQSAIEGRARKVFGGL